MTDCPRCETPLVEVKAPGSGEVKMLRCPRCGHNGKPRPLEANQLASLGFEAEMVGKKALQHILAAGVTQDTLEGMVDDWVEACGERGLAEDPFMLVAMAQVFVTRQSESDQQD